MKHKHLFILWTGSEFRPLFALAHVAFAMCLSRFGCVHPSPNVFLKYVSVYIYMYVVLHVQKGAPHLTQNIGAHVYSADEKTE